MEWLELVRRVRLRAAKEHLRRIATAGTRSTNAKNRRVQTASGRLQAVGLASRMSVHQSRFGRGYFLAHTPPEWVLLNARHYCICVLVVRGHVWQLCCFPGACT